MARTLRPSSQDLKGKNLLRNSSACRATHTRTQPERDEQRHAATLRPDIGEQRGPHSFDPAEPRAGFPLDIRTCGHISVRARNGQSIFGTATPSTCGPPCPAVVPLPGRGGGILRRKLCFERMITGNYDLTGRLRGRRDAVNSAGPSKRRTTTIEGMPTSCLKEPAMSQRCSMTSRT